MIRAKRLLEDRKKRKILSNGSQIKKVLQDRGTKVALLNYIEKTC
jgi:hypothetical protein